MKRRAGIFLAVAVLLSAGCSHIANPFWRSKPNYGLLPEEAMRAVAREIEQAVRDGNRDPDIADRDGIVVNTPEIRQAIRMRAARNELVQALLNAGHACEKPGGHLYVILSKEYKKTTTRRQRDRDALVINNEADNRWTLYEGIVKASRLPARARSAVQKIFYEVRVELMTPGQKYQTPEGEVVVKGS